MNVSSWIAEDAVDCTWNKHSRAMKEAAGVFMGADVVAWSSYIPRGKGQDSQAVVVSYLFGRCQLSHLPLQKQWPDRLNGNQSWETRALSNEMARGGLGVFGGSSWVIGEEITPDHPEEQVAGYLRGLSPLLVGPVQSIPAVEDSLAKPSGELAGGSSRIQCFLLFEGAGPRGRDSCRAISMPLVCWIAGQCLACRAC